MEAVNPNITCLCKEGGVSLWHQSRKVLHQEKEVSNKYQTCLNYEYIGVHIAFDNRMIVANHHYLLGKNRVSFNKTVTITF